MNGEQYTEAGIAVISLSEEAFVSKYSMEAFAEWYDKTYTLVGCTKEQLIKECTRADLDKDGVFITSAALHMSAAEVNEYKECNENCESIDWNNRKFGQWIEESGVVCIFMSYRNIIKNALEHGEEYLYPVMIYSSYA